MKTSFGILVLILLVGFAGNVNARDMNGEDVAKIVGTWLPTSECVLKGRGLVGGGEDWKFPLIKSEIELQAPGCLAVHTTMIHPDSDTEPQRIGQNDIQREISKSYGVDESSQYFEIAKGACGELRDENVTESYGREELFGLQYHLRNGVQNSTDFEIFIKNIKDRAGVKSLTLLYKSSAWWGRKRLPGGISIGLPHSKASAECTFQKVK